MTQRLTQPKPEWWGIAFPRAGRTVPLHDDTWPGARLPQGLRSRSTLGLFFAATARNTARREGFPPLYVGSRARWPMEEVLPWEEVERGRPRTTRVVTGSRPQHHKSGLRPPTTVRRTVRPQS